jgi:hypothetical protein
MPVQIDTPNGIGAWDEWGLWGAAPDKVSAVQNNDGDNGVIYGHSTGRVRIQLYTFSPILAATDPVTAAGLGCVARYYQPGNSTGRYFHLQWGTVIDTPYGSNQAQTIMDAGGAYTSLGFAAAGGELTLSRVNGNHGIYYGNNGGTGWECWVTYFYRSVTFDFGGGAASADTQFAHLIGSLGAVIGGNLLFREMPALNRALGRVKLHADEFKTAWRAWKAYKHPVFSR